MHIAKNTLSLPPPSSTRHRFDLQRPAENQPRPTLPQTRRPGTEQKQNRISSKLTSGHEPPQKPGDHVGNPVLARRGLPPDEAILDGVAVVAVAVGSEEREGGSGPPHKSNLGLAEMWVHTYRGVDGV